MEDGKAAEEENFAEELGGIKEAEAEKEKIIGKAQRDSERIVAEAGIEAKEITEKAAEESEKIGEEALAKTRKELEAKERQIIARAQKEAQEISGMSAPQGAVKKALESIMEHV